MFELKKKVMSRVALPALATLVAVAVASPAGAAYPTNKCVAKKQSAAAKLCAGIYKADAKALKTGGTADTTGLQAKFAASWAKAEASSNKKGVDCAETTYTASDAAATIALNIVDLTTGAPGGMEKCLGKAIKTTGALCSGLLKSESKHVKNPGKDRLRTRLAAGRTKAVSKFTTKSDKLNASICNNVLVPGGGLSLTQDLVASVVWNTTVSPNVSETDWTTITPGATVDYSAAKYFGALKTLSPQCARGTDYEFYVKRGSVNKVVMYYQGGGACWDQDTCGLNLCTQEAGGNPGNGGAYSYGLGNLNNPDNPFKDWHQVVVAYCSCDVHLGDSFQRFGIGQAAQSVQFRGRHNASVAEKWAREHFVNPEEVFSTGSSAGSMGALASAYSLMEAVWPSSQHHVMGDGYVGVTPPGFVTEYVTRWGGLTTDLQPVVPGFELSVGEYDEEAMIHMVNALASNYPSANIAMYTTAYDGPSGQTQFYRAMMGGSPAGWSDWAAYTCTVNAGMHTYLDAMGVGVDNFNYYMGAGSRHTGFGADKLYVDTSGDMPIMVDWLNDLMSGNGYSAECTDCNPIATCQGGDNYGQLCAAESDCPGGYCEEDPTSSMAPYQPDGTVVCE